MRSKKWFLIITILVTFCNKRMVSLGQLARFVMLQVFPVSFNLRYYENIALLKCSYSNAQSPSQFLNYKVRIVSLHLMSLWQLRMYCCQVLSCLIENNCSVCFKHNVELVLQNKSLTYQTWTIGLHLTHLLQIVSEHTFDKWFSSATQKV